MQSHEQSQPSIGTLIKNAACAPLRAFGFVQSFIHFAILPLEIEYKIRQSTATKGRTQSERDEEERKKAQKNLVWAQNRNNIKNRIKKEQELGMRTRKIVRCQKDRLTKFNNEHENTV